jgi:filamentous hemagglutinin
MNRSPLQLVAIALVLGVALFGYLRTQSGGPGAGLPSVASSRSDQSQVIKNVKIYSQDGRLAYQGNVDLSPVLARIERGQRDHHRNDGSIHRNREGKLPRQADREYYREYVVRTPGLKEVGPQRLIIGKAGEVFYTPDHYRSFTRVR